jgi:uncharacterized phiE125 gp8 family phage protein
MLEPVTLEMAKDYIGLIDDSSRDERIEVSITRAREYVEDHTGLALLQRQIVDEPHYLSGGSIRLYKGPVLSIDGVSYRDRDGVAQSYEPRWEGGLELFAGDHSWPILSRGGQFRVTYTAGYTEGEVPERLIGAILALVRDEFHNDGGYSAKGIADADRCCHQLRRVVLS